MKINNLLCLLVATGFISGCVYSDNHRHSYPTVQRTAPSQQQSSASLPYGLQKKLHRGQSLPPGWQKKLYVGSVLDSRIYRHSDIVVPLDRHGLVTIRVEGKLIRLYQASREIAEILN